jgi:hypothetical protein
MPRQKECGKIAAKAIVQIPFSTGKSFTVDGAGWQGTAWALQRIYPKRFSRPDIQLAQQINVDTNPPGELIVDAKLLEQLTAGYRELHDGARRHP